MVEMNNEENNAKLATQFEEQAKKRYRINPARNRNPNPVPGPQQFFTANVSQYALGQ